MTSGGITCRRLRPNRAGAKGRTPLASLAIARRVLRFRYSEKIVRSFRGPSRFSRPSAPARFSPYSCSRILVSSTRRCARLPAPLHFRTSIANSRLVACEGERGAGASNSGCRIRHTSALPASPRNPNAWLLLKRGCAEAVVSPHCAAV